MEFSQSLIRNTSLPPTPPFTNLLVSTFNPSQSTQWNKFQSQSVTGGCKKTVFHLWRCGVQRSCSFKAVNQSQRGHHEKKIFPYEHSYIGHEELMTTYEERIPTDMIQWMTSHISLCAFKGSCFLLSSRLKGRSLVAESQKPIGKMAFVWSLATWMSEISVLKRQRRPGARWRWRRRKEKYLKFSLPCLSFSRRLALYGSLFWINSETPHTSWDLHYLVSWGNRCKQQK